jgi:hypothetical protein
VYIGNDLQVAFPSYRNIDNISGSFNGVTTSFALLINGSAPVPPPLSSNQCLISVNGVIQKPDDTGASGFRLSGGNIIFSSAPAGGATFFGVVLAGADYVNAGVNFPDGSLSAPSITFDQDNDTGYYRSASGAISFSSNGVASGTWNATGVTAPSFVPTGSTVASNGIYLPSANTVAISTNGTGRLFVDSSGRVGVGTSSPSSFNSAANQFVVGSGSGSQGVTIYTGNSAGNQGSIFFADGTTGGAEQAAGYLVYEQNANYMAFGTLNTERMRLDSSGRLGLGTSSPSQPLHVVGAIASTGQASSLTASSAFIDYNTSFNLARIGSVGNTTGAAGPIYFSQYSSNASIGRDAVIIDSSGRVGIGTTPAAGSLLHLNSAASTDCKQQISVTTGTQATYTAYVNTTVSTIGTENSTGGSLASGSGPYATVISNGGAYPVQFGTNNTIRATIDSSGRLGLGTSSPGTILDVRFGTSPITDNGAGSNALRSFTTSALAVNTGGAISLGGVYHNNGDTAAFGQIAGRKENSTSNDLSGYLQFATNTGGGTMAERLRIDAAGRVGIGTTGPGATLDARGNVRVGNQGNGDGTTGIVATNGLYIGTNDDTTTTTVVPLQIGAYPAAPGYSGTPDQAIVLDGWSGSTVYHNAIINRKGRELSFHTSIGGTSFSDTNERARIDSSGRLLVGTSSARGNFFNSSVAPQIQLEGADDSDRQAAIISSSSTPGFGGVLILAHQKSGTVGGNTLVANGDELGILSFQGSDGTQFVEAARITTFVDGTPGADDMPGRLVFSTTADGGSSPTERMRLKQNGEFVCGGIYSFTTANAANVNIDSSGELRRSTSSSKYKTNIETIENNYSDALFNCRPVWYQSKSNKDNPDWGWWGFIAEEVAEIDPRLVHWKTTEPVVQENGSIENVSCDPEPEGVAYDRFVPHLLNLIKRQKEQIDAMETRLAALEGV